MSRILLFSLISSASLMAAAPGRQPFRQPLVFEPNRGQTSPQVKWLARGPGYQLFVTGKGVTIKINEGADNRLSPLLTPESTFVPHRTKYSVLHMELTGSRPWEEVTGLEPTGGISNYVEGP